MTRQKLNRILFKLCSYLLAIMVIEALWQVGTRYIIGNPSVWTDEMLRFQLIWLAMIGAPTAHGLNRVMAVTIFTDKLKGKAKNTNTIFVEVMIFIFAILILLIGGMKVALNASTQVSATLGINMFFIYVSIPLSGLLFAYYSADNIKNALKERKEFEK